MPTRKKKTIKRKKKPIESKLCTNSKQIKQRCINCNSSIIKKSLHKVKLLQSLNPDKDIVKKIQSRLIFTMNNTTKLADLNQKKKTKEYHSPYRPDGLSQKEKSYVICTCQARTTRYRSLKNMAEQAIRECKIFSVYGSCKAVRKALLERGWVEKIPANKMNLTKIKNGTFSSKPEVHGELERLLLSNFVEKCPPNFIWRTRDEVRDTTIDMNKEYSTIVNKLKNDALWTSKQGLCSSMKRNYWFYIEDVAEVTGPRGYTTSDPGEVEGFVNDYKMTACTSLLKWVLSMVANERPVFKSSGKISLNVVLFALNRCKEYLYRKQNKDIDRAIGSVATSQWNAFLKKYYRIIGKDDVFQADTENNLPLYMSYAKFLLKQMHKYRPQLSCEGCHNIWIIKPAHNSRGRGIRMASKLVIITGLLNKANAKYVIQKYIEEPLLIHETKFDIRQYCLVTSTYPLVIWMYKDCYLKFSSQKYNLKNYHESIHLTNNAVQKKYTNCAGRHEELPPVNMWDSDKYKEYLNRIDKDKVWDNIIYPGMKKSIIAIMLSCQDSLSVCKNRFELYGCDFILDKEYKPWLIEINSCPDLNPTTPVTAKICPAVLTDLIKVVIDYANDPSCSTGKFECIYRQPMTIPKYGAALDLYVRGLSLPNDYFYKGTIEINESYDYDVDIDKEKNIMAILEKIKQNYDSETIMVEPEDDSYMVLKKEQETSTRHSRSDRELDMAATVVTEQLEELLERITSDNSGFTAISRQETVTPLASIKSHLTPASSLKSIDIDIKSLLKFSSSHRQSPVEATSLSHKKSFNFSQLDDGPVGKGSFVGVNATKNIFNDFKQLEMFRRNNEQDSMENTRSPSLSEEIMLEATTKLIDFINKKEQEYLKDFNEIRY